VSPSGTGIDVKVFYVGVSHKFDDIWSVNVTTDFNYVSNDSETQVFIKKAYLQATLSDSVRGAGRLGGPAVGCRSWRTSTAIASSRTR